MKSYIAYNLLELGVGIISLVVILTISFIFLKKKEKQELNQQENQDGR